MEVCDGIAEVFERMMFFLKVIQVLNDEECGISIDRKLFWASKLSCLKGYPRLFCLNDRMKRPSMKGEIPKGAVCENSTVYQIKNEEKGSVGTRKNAQDRDESKMALALGVSIGTDFEFLLDACVEFFDDILSIIIIRSPAKVDAEKSTNRLSGCGSIVLRFSNKESFSSFSNAFSFSSLNVISSTDEQNNDAGKLLVFLELKRFEMDKCNGCLTLFESGPFDDFKSCFEDTSVHELPICAFCLRRIKGSFSGLDEVDAHPVVRRSVLTSIFQ